MEVSGHWEKLDDDKWNESAPEVRGWKNKATGQVVALYDVEKAGFTNPSTGYDIILYNSEWVQLQRLGYAETKKKATEKAVRWINRNPMTGI